MIPIIISDGRHWPELIWKSFPVCRLISDIAILRATTESIIWMPPYTIIFFHSVSIIILAVKNLNRLLLHRNPLRNVPIRHHAVSLIMKVVPSIPIRTASAMAAINAPTLSSAVLLMKTAVPRIPTKTASATVAINVLIRRRAV